MKLLIFVLCFIGLALPIVFAGEGSEDKKVLIIYYSLTGRTKAVAERIQSKTAADLHEIQTVKTYALTYPDVYEVPKRELEENNLPELRSPPPDISEYDVVIVGAPVWWYTVPTPLMKFLQQIDFQGKVVASFCTYDTTLGQYHPHFIEQVVNGTVREGISLSYPHRIPPQELDARLDSWLASVMK